MKKFFLLGVVGGVVAAFAIYFLYKVVEACVQVVLDWRYAREMDRLADEARRKRETGEGW